MIFLSVTSSSRFSGFWLLHQWPWHGTKINPQQQLIGPHLHACGQKHWSDLCFTLQECLHPLRKMFLDRELSELIQGIFFVHPWVHLIKHLQPWWYCPKDYLFLLSLTQHLAISVCLENKIRIKYFLKYVSGSKNCFPHEVIKKNLCGISVHYLDSLGIAFGKQKLESSRYMNGLSKLHA